MMTMPVVFVCPALKRRTKSSSFIALTPLCDNTNFSGFGIANAFVM